MAETAGALEVEVEREDDGRWLAEVPALPGALAYGETPEEAIARAEALALRVLAERLEHGEPTPEFRGLSSGQRDQASLASSFSTSGRRRA